MHPVAVLNTAFCMTCSLFMLVDDARGDYTEEAYSRTFGCVAMGSALLLIVRSRFLVYSARSGVNRVQVVLSGFSMTLFCFVHAKTLCRYGCMYFFAALINVCRFIVLKALLISSATVIVRAGGAIWLNPSATVLFSVCSAITVECCVLNRCCMGVFNNNNIIYSKSNIQRI